MIPGGTIDAVVSINKPAGPTSFDMVWLLRKALGVKKAGHCGTLDPFATGLLLICTGKATRIAELLMRRPKVYRAGLLLGVTTTTGDPTGEVTETRDASGVTEAHLAGCIPAFTGEIMQRPHRFSAIKKDGRRLYDLARSGEAAEAPERPVTIYRLEIISMEPAGDDGTVRAVLEIECSSGTYIRSLAEDMGGMLGTGGTLYSLERTRIGAFRLDGAIGVPPPGPSGQYGAEGASMLAAELENPVSRFVSGAVGSTGSEGPLVSMDRALDWLPGAVCNEGGAKAVSNGGPLRACLLSAFPKCGAGETVAVRDSSGTVLALHTWVTASNGRDELPINSSVPDRKLSRPLKVLAG